MKTLTRTLSLIGLTVVLAIGLSIGITVGTNPAHAIYQPGWDRPTEMAKMQVTRTTYAFEGVETLSLVKTKQDGSQILGYSIEYRTPSTGELIMRRFKVDSVESDCGSTVYNTTLDESSEPVKLIGLGDMMGDAQILEMPSVQSSRFKLKIWDHRTRICEDVRPGIWEMHLSEEIGLGDQVESELEAFGNPEPVYTIMNQN